MKTNQISDMSSDAVISKCQQYRYFLSRIWNNHADPKALLIIGLNPSTADHTKDDPTIRRCIGFARDWGYDGLWMANLFAYRATDPAVMKAAKNPVGTKNDEWIKSLSAKASLTVVAWGTHGVLGERDKAVMQLLSEPHHLGLTKDGHPRHPLYLKKSVLPTKLIF